MHILGLFYLLYMILYTYYIQFDHFSEFSQSYLLCLTFTDFSIHFIYLFICFSFNPIPLCLTSFSFLSLFNLLCRFSSYITFPLCFPNLWNTKLFTISRESGPGSVEINSASCLENPAQIMSWTQQKGLRLHILPIS